MKNKSEFVDTAKSTVTLPVTQYEILAGAVRNAEADINCRFYNPFDYYYFDPEKGIGKQSLYLEFASLSETKNEEILKFVNKYGLPRRDVLGTSTSYPINQFQEEVKEMRALINLWKALAENNKKHIHFYALEIHQLWVASGGLKGTPIKEKGRPVNKPVSIINKSAAQGLFVSAINNMLQGMAYPVFEYVKNQIRESWYVEDLLTAMYLMFAMDITRNERLMQCQHQTCRKFFNPDRLGKRYCSPRCAHAQAQIRFERGETTPRKKKEAKKS